MMRGTVRKVNKEKGYGFVRCTQTGAEFFFHRTQLKIPNHFETLEEGQPVTFDTADNPKGPRAVNVELV